MRADEEFVGWRKEEESIPDREKSIHSQVENGTRAERVPGMAGHPSSWSLAREDVGTEGKAQASCPASCSDSPPCCFCGATSSVSKRVEAKEGSDGQKREQLLHVCSNAVTFIFLVM